MERDPGTGRPLTWSDYWEESEYPFVVLEGNRAACAICLMDFEEPKRKLGSSGPSDEEDKDAKGETAAEPAVDGTTGKGETVETEKEPNGAEPSQNPDSGITLETRAGESSGLHLEDAGEEAQPLRLLACGHVFHVRKKFTGYRSASLDAHLLYHPHTENVLGSMVNRCLRSVPSVPATSRNSRTKNEENTGWNTEPDIITVLQCHFPG